MILTGERMILNRMNKDTEIEHLCRYKYAKQFVQGKRVLDAACGSGYGSKMLAESAESVIGMDISEEAIQYAQNNYAAPNVDFIVGSVEKLPFEDNFFDIIISFETIEHVNEQIQNSFLREIKRVLKDDGILIMSTPDKKLFTDERSGKPSEFHVKEFYKEEFLEFLYKEFKNVEFKRQFYAKVNCIIGEERYAKTEGFENEGMYLIAIAYNDNQIKNIESSIFKYPSEIEKFDEYLQIYYAFGEQYSEQNSQIVQYNSEQRKQEITIKLDGIQCDHIRLDPMVHAGEVIIQEVKIYYMDGTCEKIVNSNTNADIVQENKYVSYLGDLQLEYIFKQKVQVDFINVCFEMVHYGESTLREYINQNIKSKESIEESLKEEIQNKEQVERECCELRKNLEDIQKKYECIKEENEKLNQRFFNKVLNKISKLRFGEK